MNNIFDTTDPRVKRVVEINYANAVENISTNQT